MDTSLDRLDMQGLLLFGYGRQPAATYLMLRVDDPRASRAWLLGLLPGVTHGGEDRAGATSLNLAFTHPGIEKLAGSEEFVGFSREFVEGMVTPHRQRILGDLLVP